MICDAGLMNITTKGQDRQRAEVLLSCAIMKLTLTKEMQNLESTR